MKATFLTALLGFAAAVSDARAADAVTLRVEVDQPGAALNRGMWGIFFEDINFAGDGGLHAELIKNRSFEFNDPMMGWKEFRADKGDGKIEIQRDRPYTAANPNYVHVSVTSGGVGLTNEGHRGVGLKASATYDFAVAARAGDAAGAKLRVELIGDNGKVLATTRIADLPAEWEIVTATLKPTGGANKGKVNVVVEGAGTVDLDHVSLYPHDTWKNRPHGLRADLVQLLADMKPGFMRFPGGCIVEGHDLAGRYQWKNTIGRPEDRPSLFNRWNDEFKHRLTPDYYQSFGLGFFEFFQLCEDIGAAPLPILNCGMACQFNTGELCPIDALEPYIQDALDLIEFANGPADSEWGKKRAAMGHPEPFKLTMIGVGNEQWGPQYVERYDKFAAAIKAKYPAIKLIAAAGPSPDGKDFDFAWQQLRERKADIVDEHYYRKPGWFLDQSQRYDKYDRNGPKVFSGEYAAQSVDTVRPDNKNTWECALAEAAAMTGFERNGDVVTLASYAPLSAHVDAWQWTPNLIWFDNNRVYGTPSYYVQKLFGTHAGDAILPLTLAGVPHAPNGQPRLYASATRRTAENEIIVKLVNATGDSVPVKITLGGGKLTIGGGKIITLTGDLKAENSLDKPKAIFPQEKPLTISGPTFTQTCPPQSVILIKLPVK